MQQGFYRIRRGARQRVRGTVDREQSQDTRRAQGGLAWQLHQEPGELGKDKHQFVMEPLPGGRARLDRSRRARVNSRSAWMSSAGKVWPGPARRADLGPA